MQPQVSCEQSATTVLWNDNMASYLVELGLLSSPRRGHGDESMALGCSDSRAEQAKHNLCPYERVPSSWEVQLQYGVSVSESLDCTPGAAVRCTE